MKILVYENRKSDPEYFDASTEEKELAAYLYVFQCLDSQWDMYDDLKEVEDVDFTQVCALCKANFHNKCDRNTEHCFCMEDENCIKHSKIVKREYQDITSQKKLYDAALKGDSKAARALLRERFDYDYNNVQLHIVRNPLDAEEENPNAE